MGKFVMRFTDDRGETWSAEQYLVPYRLTSIDYKNEWHGNVTIMWTVDSVKQRDGVVYFGFTKIGEYLLGPPEEMWLMASPNLLSASDPKDITWRLLPDGDVGIKPVGGIESTNIEEAHVLPLTASDKFPRPLRGVFFVNARTLMGCANPPYTSPPPLVSSRGR